MKLHIACGDVYLKGYTNVDVQGIFAKDLKTENPNETTLDNYFKYPFGSPRREIIIDKRMNLLQPWDFEDSSVEEIVMISCIEHFTKTQAEFIVSEIKRVLKPHGVFVFDFPDIRETVKKYYDSDPEYMARLIYCNQKDEYSLHKWGYTWLTIRKLLGEGWLCIQKLTVVIHIYPMIGVACTMGEKE